MFRKHILGLAAIWSLVAAPAFADTQQVLSTIDTGSLPCNINGGTSASLNGLMTVGSCVAATGLLTSTVSNPTSNQVVMGPIDTAGAQSFSFQYVQNSGSNFNLQVQASDSVTGPWALQNVQSSANASIVMSGFTGTNGLIFEGPVKHRYLEIVATSTTTGNATIIGYLRSVPFVDTLSYPGAFFSAASGLPVSAIGAGAPQQPRVTSSAYTVVVPYSTPEMTWQWSTAGTPITAPATTQIQAAGATGVRNYLASLQCTNNSTNTAEAQILDGSTVIWDGALLGNTLPGSSFSVNFLAPLRGSAATTMSLKTLTGTISGFCSAQGYQAY